jgi:dephospho-CoA kinase
MNEVVKENQSEYSSLPKTFIIKNNGTLSDLEYEVEKILNQIRRR